MEHYQIAIIGGGPAGYTAAEKAGRAGMSVVLFEKNSLGGVCLNEGCIPTKTLLYSAKTYDNVKSASKYGVSTTGVSFDLGKIIARKQKVVRKLVLGVKSRLAAEKVKVVTGEATIKDAKSVVCGGETYSCENLIICAGSKTFIPSVEGIENISYWTHREALNNKEVPNSLIVVGGGVIGMEFASFFNSLGVEVTVIEMMDEILGEIDSEIAGLLRADYAKRGVKFLTGTKVVRFDRESGQFYVYYENAGGEGFVCGEKVLMSVGRRPQTEGYGLETLGLELTERGRIKVDSHLETSVKGVYVCGDLNGVSLLAHTAVREAEVAVAHILGKEDEMSYKAIPGVVYTNPEVASVGLTEDMIKKSGKEYNAVKIPMAFSGRFVAENEGVNGVIKAITDKEERLLGVHIYGNPASELIVIAGMMIEDGRGLDDLKRYVFPHPSVSEIYKEL